MFVKNLCSYDELFSTLPVLQRKLLEQLKAIKHESDSANQRVAIITVLGELTNLDPQIRAELSDLVRHNQRLAEIAKHSGKKFLINIGQAVAPAAMATTDLIRQHFEQHPNDFIYLHSVMHQAVYSQLPSLPRSEFAHPILDKKGLRQVVLAPLLAYLRKPTLETKGDFENLMEAMMFIRTVRLYDSEVVNLVKRWSHQESWRDWVRWFRFRFEVKNVNYHAQETLKQFEAHNTAKLSRKIKQKVSGGAILCIDVF